MPIIKTKRSIEFDAKALDLYNYWLEYYHDEQQTITHDELSKWFGQEVGLSIKRYYESLEQEED
jgi:hypothetical protein